MPKISKNIKKLRAEKNITQDALAEKIHVTRQAISNWENDKTKPDIDALQSLAEALEVDIEELIYGVKKEVIQSADKTKEKNRIKIILAIIGSLFVAVGISLVFFGFWQDFSLTMKTTFSFVPIILAQAFAIFAFFNKKKNLIWRECASVIWTIGVVSTIALIDYAYDISWVYTDYLIIDSILIIPIMFIFGAVSPLIFFYYMSLHIATIETLQGIIFSAIFFGIGVLFTFLISKNREDGRSKYAQWITILASIPLVIIFAIAGMRSDLLADSEAVLLAFVLSYLLCLFIAMPKESSLSLPYKPVSLLGICGLMSAFSITVVIDTPRVDGEWLPFIISAVLFVGAPIVTFIIKRDDYEYEPLRIATVALPFVRICSIIALTIIDNLIESTIFDDEIIIMRILSAVTIAFGILIVYQGIKKVQLFTINLGVVAIFFEIMFGYYSGDVLVLGILLVLFGAGLIAINWKMLSIKKSLKQQGGGIDE